MVGLIGAMAVELEQLKAQMENLREEKIGMDVLYTGTLFGQEVVLAVCGPGKVNAALCAQSMILRHHPRWILNLGVAGAGEAGVSIGDMVVASCTVQHDMDTSPIGDPGGICEQNWPGGRSPAIRDCGKSSWQPPPMYRGYGSIRA